MDLLTQIKRVKSVSPVRDVVWRQTVVGRVRGTPQSPPLDGSTGFSTSSAQRAQSRRIHRLSQPNNRSSLQLFHQEQLQHLENKRLSARVNSTARLSSNHVADDYCIPSAEQKTTRQPSVSQLTCTERKSTNITMNDHGEGGMYGSGDPHRGGGMYAASPPRNILQPVMSSPIMSRRDLSGGQQGGSSGMMPPQHLQGQPIPVQPQMLVDPTTGQHYIVPQPQFYYPMIPAMYYPAASTAQQGGGMQQPQPMQSYGMGPPQSPTSVRNGGFFRNGTAPGPPQAPSVNSQGYYVEMPPSSNVSICGGTNDHGIPPEYYVRPTVVHAGASRTSLESGSSSSTNQYGRSSGGGPGRESLSSSPAPSMNYNSAGMSVTAQMAAYTNKPPSPPKDLPTPTGHQGYVVDSGTPRASNPPPTTSFAQMPSTTSSSTSGFASGAGESTADQSCLSGSAAGLTKTRPAWWNASENTSRLGGLTLSEKSSPERCEPPAKEAEPKSTSFAGLVGQSTPPETAAHEPVTSKPVMKAIRMDIDLSAPVTPVEPPRPKLRSSAPNSGSASTCGTSAGGANRATAFTVSFNDTKPVKAPPPLSSQDVGVRRLARRSVPATLTSKDDSDQNSNQDPKHYLFNKMIQGYGQDGDSLEINSPTTKANGIDDTVSEAGTYVVAPENRKLNMSQYLGIDDSDADADVDADSDATAEGGGGGTSATSDLATPEAEQQPSKSMSLFAEHLKQIKERSKPKTDSVGEAASSNGAQKPVSRIRPQTAGLKNNSNFRRADGGRFSMRTGGNPLSSGLSGPHSARTPNSKDQQPLNSGQHRPPFKTGLAASAQVHPSAPAKKPLIGIRETPEMVAWLRRKEYDPRKSAAEARKIQQLKARDSFHQNRSMSFNPSSTLDFVGSSHADDVVSPSCVLSHENIARHNLASSARQQAAAADATPTTPPTSTPTTSDASVQNQVDKLTAKCMRSIRLIKLCNQNTLSESVENLLDSVVSPTTTTQSTDPAHAVGGPDIHCQLDRLSSALDAIEKYFEEQRASSMSPPAYRRSPRPKTATGAGATGESSKRHI